MVQFCDAYVTQVSSFEDEVTVGSPIARPSDKSKRGLRRPAALKTHKPSSGVAFLSTASGARQRLATNDRVCRYQFVTFRTLAQSLTLKRPHPSTVAQDLGPADWLHHPRDG
jgi:hypothetical protein